MFAPLKALKPLQRFAYLLTMQTEDPKKSFVERHQIALDYVMARDLAIDGLDAYCIRPRALYNVLWDTRPRMQAFVQARSQGVLLEPEWARTKA